MADLKPNRIVQIATTTADSDTLYALDQSGAMFAMEDPPDDDGEEAWIQIAPPKDAGRIVQVSVVSGDEHTADYLYVLDDRGEVYFISNPTDPDGAWLPLVEKK